MILVSMVETCLTFGVLLFARILVSCSRQRGRSMHRESSHSFHGAQRRRKVKECNG